MWQQCSICAHIDTERNKISRVYVSIDVWFLKLKNSIVCSLLPLTDCFACFVLQDQHRWLTQITQGYKYLVWQIIFCNSQESANLNSRLWRLSLNVEASKASHGKNIAWEKSFSSTPLFFNAFFLELRTRFSFFFAPISGSSNINENLPTKGKGTIWTLQLGQTQVNPFWWKQNMHQI